MKYIGEGYYYKVYEYDAGRVLKKLQSFWFSFRKVYTLERGGGASVLQAATNARSSVLKERRALWEMRSRLAHVPLSLFGNLTFIGSSLSYTQDRVRMIEEALTTDSFEQSKIVIDKYMELQKKFWSYGFHDKTYKLQPNYGIDKNGEVVCIDFGEFVFTKEEALKSIGKQKWLSRRSYKKWDDVQLKEYYTQCMAATMTPENLTSLWREQ